MTRPLLRWLDRVDTDQRRTWAARLLIWSVIGWLVSQILMFVLPPWFFQVVLLGVSWLAISLTAVDVVVTSDVREQQDTS